MSGSHLFYNKCLLRDCRTTAFEQLLEFDEASGTDPLYNRFRITVEAELTAATFMSASQFPHEPLSAISLPSIPGLTLADRIAEMRRLLSEPRKDFWYAVNAATSKSLALQSGGDVPSDEHTFNDSYRVLLAASGLDDGGEVEGFVAGRQGTATKINREDVLDFNNGPKPVSVQITEVKGGQAVRIAFTIEVCRWFCETPVVGTDGETPAAPVIGATKGVGVISNRWSIEESIDETWSTTFVIDGTLVVKDHRYKPHAKRHMTNCALFPYAKLESRNFAESSDGLTLKYRYVMKEAGDAPPPGVVDWTGKYVERALNGGHTTGEVQVSVRGTQMLPPDMTRRHQKSLLRDLCLAIIESRLTLVGRGNSKLPGNNPKTAVLLDIVFVEDMKLPVVEARAIVKHADATLGPDMELRLLNFGKPISELPEYDPMWWPEPAMFAWDVQSMAKEKGHLGDAHNHYFQTPCSEWHGKPEGLVDEEELPDSEQTGVPAEFYVFDAVSQSPTMPVVAPKDGTAGSLAFSDVQLSSGFTYVHVEADTVYSSDTGMISLPLSKPRNGQSMVSIQLHAGAHRRVFTMVATREGDWPKVPEPKPVVTRPAASSVQLPLVETLTKKKVAPDVPKLSQDGTTMVYSVQIMWEYTLSRAPDQEGDYFQVGSDPMDNTLPADNRLPISRFYDRTGNVYDSGV